MGAPEDELITQESDVRAPTAGSGCPEQQHYNHTTPDYTVPASPKPSSGVDSIAVKAGCSKYHHVKDRTGEACCRRCRG